MVLNAEANPIEILLQPVILKTNTGIRIGLRCCLAYQRLNRFDFMSDPCECFPFAICVSISELNR